MNLFYLVIFPPLISFVTLALLSYKLPKNYINFIGIVPIIISFFINLNTIYYFFNSDSILISKNLFQWISIDNFIINISFNLDQLSLSIILLVSIVGSLIQMYASWYINNEQDRSRFFIYTNLFIFSMFIMSLSDNIILLYLGWELMSFCSYLLVGFYYKNKENGISAIKSFIITKMSDLFILLSFIMIYVNFNTLSICEIFNLLSKETNFISNNLIFLITLSLLIGSIGKSAQVPLHLWLIYAMKGPIPASALIHSATMVNSGVYMISRMYHLFSRDQVILNIIIIIGMITFLLSSISAIFQRDIKKILAYSTMSQIGYMFIMLGMKAWNTALLHLIVHSFFKSLLFLISGSLIKSCNYDQDILKIRKNLDCDYMDIIYFLFGSLSLSALPILTSGFYSKEEILKITLDNNIFIFILLLFGSILTSFYVFRVLFIIFFKNSFNSLIFFKNKELSYHTPLLVLSILSTFLGYFFAINVCSYKVENSFINKYLIFVLSLIFFVLSFLVSLYLFLYKKKIVCKNNTFMYKIFNLFKNNFGFFYFYEIINKNIIKYINEFINFKNFIASVNLHIYLFLKTRYILSKLVNGKLNWYIFVLVLGYIFVIFINLFFIKFIK